MFSNNHKLHNLVEIISEFDEEFQTLAEYDIDECVDRIKYFIQKEENLNILETSTFKSLVEQIEDFYRENENLESLMEFNYTIRIYFDFIEEKQAITIIKNELNESDFSTTEYFEHEESIHFREEHLIYDSVKSEDISKFKFNNNSVNNDKHKKKEFLNKQDFETYTLKKQFFDATFSCEEKQVQTDGDISLTETEINNYSEGNTDSLEGKNKEFKVKNSCKIKTEDHLKQSTINTSGAIQMTACSIESKIVEYIDPIHEKHYVKDLNDLVIEPQIREVLKSSEDDPYFGKGKLYSDIEYDDSLLINQNKFVQNQYMIQNNSLLEELENACSNQNKTEQKSKFHNYLSITEEDIAYKEFIIKNEINVTVQYSCDQCYYKSREKCNLVTHIMSFHNGEQYPCERCEYNVRNKFHLKFHLKSIHEGVQYNCGQCDYMAKSKLILMKHVQSTHNGDTKKLPNGWKIPREWKSRKRKLPKKWKKWRLPKRWKEYKRRL